MNPTCSCRGHSVSIDFLCKSCGRQRDDHSFLEDRPYLGHISTRTQRQAERSLQYEGPVAHPTRPLLSVNTGSRTSSKASKGLPLHHKPIPSEQVITSSNHPAPLKGSSVNVNKHNLSQIVSPDKHSRLEDYLSVNPEDPWNHEWVAYAARPRFPGESVFSSETWEPATTPRRQRYSPARRADVAYTREKKACAGCRRRHQKCPHRLRERDEAALQQVMDEGVTFAGADRMASDMPVDGQLSTQQSEATISLDTSTSTTPTPLLLGRTRDRRIRGRRQGRPGASDRSYPTLSQRQSRKSSSSVLDEEHETRLGRPYVADVSESPRLQPAKHVSQQQLRTAVSKHHRGGMSGPTRRETGRNVAARESVRTPNLSHSTQSWSDQDPYTNVSHDLGPSSAFLRTDQELMCVPTIEQDLPTLPDNVWNAEDFSWPYNEPLGNVLDTSSLDQLLAASQQDDIELTTQQPVRPAEALRPWNPCMLNGFHDTIDAAQANSNDNHYHDRDDTGINPAVESYTALLFESPLPSRFKSLRGSNSDPISTPPSGDITGPFP